MALIWQERKIGLHRADAPVWDAAVAHIRRKLNSDVLNLVDFSFHFNRNQIHELFLSKYTFFILHFVFPSFGSGYYRFLWQFRSRIGVYAFKGLWLTMLSNYESINHFIKAWLSLTYSIIMLCWCITWCSNENVAQCTKNEINNNITFFNQLLHVLNQNGIRLIQSKESE